MPMFFYKIKIYGYPGYLFKLTPLINIHITLFSPKILQHITVGLIPSNTLFYYRLLLNGTNEICKVAKLLMFLEAICLRVSDLSQNSQIIFISP